MSETKVKLTKNENEIISILLDGAEVYRDMYIGHVFTNPRHLTRTSINEVEGLRKMGFLSRRLINGFYYYYLTDLGKSINID